MKKLAILVHVLILVLILASPFIFSWKIVLGGIIIYYIQIFIIGDCILTRYQLKSLKRDETFWWYILAKLGFNFEKRRVRIFADYILPLVLLAISIIRT